MPLFKVVVTEEVTRRLAAFVEAPDERAADVWASNASPELFRKEAEMSDPWGAVESIEAVKAAPDGWRIVATAGKAR